MKKTFITLLFIIGALLVTNAQEQRKPQTNRRKFSPEEFQKRQQEFITQKANLTAEEAAAFFPLFFEHKKEIFTMQRNMHELIAKEVRKKELTEEEYTEVLNKTSDLKVEIAKLEREHIIKILQQKVIPAKKLWDIQRAEQQFQNHMLKSLSRGNSRNEHKRERAKPQFNR